MSNQSPLKNTYTIGYGKPPKDTQFKSGQSGNLKGRPKEHRNMATCLQKALHERITVVENGQSKRLTLLEIGCKQIARKVAKGDLKAIQWTQIIAENGQSTNAFDKDVEQKILAHLKLRLSGQTTL